MIPSCGLRLIDAIVIATLGRSQCSLCRKPTPDSAPAPRNISQAGYLPPEGCDLNPLLTDIAFFAVLTIRFPRISRAIRLCPTRRPRRRNASVTRGLPQLQSVYRFISNGLIPNTFSVPYHC